MVNTDKGFEAGCLVSFTVCVMIGIILVCVANVIQASAKSAEKAAHETAKELLSCPNVEHRCRWQCVDLKTAPQAETDTCQ